MTRVIPSMEAVGSCLFRGSKEGPGSYRDGIPEDVVLALHSTHMKQKPEGKAY